MNVTHRINLLEGIIDRYTATGSDFDDWLHTTVKQFEEVFPHFAVTKELRSVLESFLYHRRTATGGVHIPHYGRQALGIIERQLEELYLQEDARYLTKPCYPKELNFWYRNFRRERDVLHRQDFKLTGWLESALAKFQYVVSVKGISDKSLIELQNEWNAAIDTHDSNIMTFETRRLAPKVYAELNKVVSIVKAEIKQRIEKCDESENRPASVEYNRRISAVTDEIKSLPEVQEKLKEFKSLRSKAKSAYNKYKRSLPKYQFLNIIILPKILGTREEDDNLEFAVRDLFNSIGIKSYVPTNKDDFDVVSSFKAVRVGFEIKNGHFPTENDMLQAFKYKGRYNEPIHAILLYNNATSNQEFDRNRIKDAEKHGYGIMLTKELHKGYLKLKHGKITFDQFLNQLQLTGLIKFSSRALGKPKNSDVAR